MHPRILAVIAVVISLASACASAPPRPPEPGNSAAPVAAPVPVVATPADAEPLVRRAHDFAAMFVPQPALPAGTFSEALAKLFPGIKDALARIHGQYGAVREVRLVERLGASGARFEFRFVQPAKLTVRIYIEEAAPHLVGGLWFGEPVPEMASLDAAVEQLQKLPGQVSFAVCRLGAGPMETVAQLEPDRALAIGSAFKLYILGALIDDVREGRRRWDEVTTLQERFRSLPSGTLQTWPVGAPVTLHTLASMMISRSDNTATDHLLFLLGRQRVESMLEPMGNRHLERNRPFLSTAEMFRLKGIDGGAAGKAFLAKAAGERQAFLEAEVATLPLDKVSFDTPRMISELEWFASAHDLCRAMDALRKASESGPGAAARGVLGMNVPAVEKGQFAWAGYKGGSEPGVLNLTYLVQGREGSWWAVSAGWNHDAKLEEEKLLAIVGGVLQHLAASPAR